MAPEEAGRKGTAAKGLHAHSQALLFKLSNEYDTVSSKIYICPLAFKYYTLKVLENDSIDRLTLEHAPPESVGGKIVALTAKNLNSQSGSDLDWKAKEYVSIQDFLKYVNSNKNLKIMRK